MGLERNAGRLGSLDGASGSVVMRRSFMSSNARADRRDYYGQLLALYPSRDRSSALLGGGTHQTPLSQNY